MLSTRLLFLCNDNTFLSVLAEALANSMSDGSVRAFSAGLLPAGHVDPMVFELLHEEGIAGAGLSSKSWQIFTFPDAPGIDRVITLSPRTALVALPAFMGDPPRLRMVLDDPREITCPAERRWQARLFLRRLKADLCRLMDVRSSEMPLDLPVYEGLCAKG
ncbi:MAG: hypothetical protein KDI98_06905 [Hyphomicrobiaceae bacterium]|nr:hypothetical protein [Hyphomicrobiaceae bacterium]